MSDRPVVLVIGPTPPPAHGPAVFTRMVLDSPAIHDAVDLRHVDISDRRDLGNIGRLDLRNVWLGLRHLSKVAWACAVSRPAVVHVQPSQNVLAFVRDAGFIVLGWASGAAVIVHLHGGSFHRFVDRAPAAVRVLVGGTLRLVAQAWVLGEDLRECFQGLVDPARIRVMANGISDGERAVRDWVSPDSLEPDAPVLRVLHLGQLALSKGTDRVIEAVERLQERGLDVRLTLAGDWGSPADRDRLSPLVERGGRWLTHEGVVTGAEKWALFRSHDAFALLSRPLPGEGQPLSILEAMAAGMTVVATRRGAVPETLGRGQAGVLVDDGVDHAVSALERLICDPALRRRLGRAALRRFEEDYSEAAFTRRFADGLLSVARDAR